ncbi:septation protein SepH [Nocardia alni]|uniref:septation protein SepH n=1 Tax=Nocardia alni TaxID=2815723 RepID=UPI001C242326|nr:septation protein SepH [Nocardia alni]
MRELRVIGLTPDSAHIVCIDAETGQKYKLAADEKLRAAARGDLARFGQIEIETEATMRPRDIQARIRAGASVEQVTEESGMPMSRVERFAYPVLLERARAAELAQKAHPVRKDGPAVETLIQVVSAAFAERGHNIDIAEWDAWKDEKGYWVAQLQWQAGRSVIAAHWRFQPDAHGGSVSPLDDPASDLVDPDFGRSLRGLATILPEPTAEQVEPVTPVPPTPAPLEEPPAARVAVSEPRVQEYPVEEIYENRAVVGGSVPVTPPGPAHSSPTREPAPVHEPSAPAAEYAAPVRENSAPVREPAAPEPQAAPSAPAAKAPAPAAKPPAPAAKPAAKAPAPAAKAASATAAKADADKPAEESAPQPAKQTRAKPKRGKAPMPSWEDVLLGVRSSGH